MNVYFDLDQLPHFRNTAVTIGSFDGVHQGHQRILEQLRHLAARCGGAGVVVTFDPHPRTVLRPDDQHFKLINTTREKIALLERYGVQHLVVAPFNAAFSQLSARSYVEDFLIEKFHPRYVVIGYDHHFGANREGNINLLQQYARRGMFEIVEIPVEETDHIAISSSKIRQALERAELPAANRLLGHPWSLSGKVVEGNKIGRTIGFPTANIHIEDPYKLLIPNGIYAATALNEQWPAMLYIGDRPSIPGAKGRVVEAHLLDYEGDLYGQYLEVYVHDFIRADKKLSGLEALRQQIEADRLVIQERLAQLPAQLLTQTN
jgi:riboflavin kinase/FMN adenylyltransferase